MISKISSVLFPILFLLFIRCSYSELTAGFYNFLCPEAEETVRYYTSRVIEENPFMQAKLLRLHYHDCFVRGCDGSLLLDAVTEDSPVEKDSPANLFMDGYDFVDEVKSALEQVCPGTVSCADILALVARDAISHQFKRTIYDVLTGRRDGTSSVAEEAAAGLPSPFFNFKQLKQMFAANGLFVQDLVVLSGAHTIGVAPCNAFINRLNPQLDPTLNSTYTKELTRNCNQLEVPQNVSLDPESGFQFDSHYYVALKENKDLLSSDAALLTDPGSMQIVEQLVDQDRFLEEFGWSMQRMGSIGVLTGVQGEVRRTCRKVNLGPTQPQIQLGNRLGSHSGWGALVLIGPLAFCLWSLISN